MKLKYIEPTLEIFEFAVECTASLSPIETTEFIGDIDKETENIAEGESYDIFKDDKWF